MKRALCLATLLAVACTSATAETGIKAVVKLVETRYAIRHHGVFGLWLAKPFLFGSGVSGLKIANFENFRIPAKDVYALKEEMRQRLGPEWSPFVETWSKRSGNWSVIYARTSVRDMKMLILTSEADESVTVLQMNVSGKARDWWFDEPVENAKRETAKGADMSQARAFAK